jgi:hypothetical protein
VIFDRRERSWGVESGRISRGAVLFRWIARGLLAALFACGLLVAVLGGGSSVVARPVGRTATVAGHVRFCGGPSPGGCHTAPVGFCQPPQGCVTSDQVAAINARGRRVATQKLRHAGFRLHLAAGSYTIELLGGGSKVHGRVMERRQVRARVNHRTRVIFSFDVP